VKLLSQDHRVLLDCIEQFEEAMHEDKHSIAERFCRLITVHTQIEEELLYPAAHEAFGSDSQQIAVAQVEHAVMKDLVSQIEDLDEVDELFEAKMQVLGEQLRHHIQEEEGTIFPKLERTSLDLEVLGEQLVTRKRELTGEDEEMLVAYEYEEEEVQEPRGRRSTGNRTGRSTLIHSGRR
jgi:hemerythrin-like domain-containing protein